MSGYVESGPFRIYMRISGYGVRDERDGTFVADCLTFEQAIERAEQLSAALEGPEPDGYRVGDGGNILPTSR